MQIGDRDTRGQQTVIRMFGGQVRCRLGGQFVEFGSRHTFIHTQTNLLRDHNRIDIFLCSPHTYASHTYDRLVLVSCCDWFKTDAQPTRLVALTIQFVTEFLDTRSDLIEVHLLFTAVALDNVHCNESTRQRERSAKPNRAGFVE